MLAVVSVPATSMFAHDHDRNALEQAARPPLASLASRLPAGAHWKP